MFDLTALFSSDSSQKLTEVISLDRLCFSDRDILKFRLSPAFQRFIDEFAATTDDTLTYYLNLLSTLCADYDFSYQFGDFGGHNLLKRHMRDYPEYFDMCCELITVITGSGCKFPMSKNILHVEQVLRPTPYLFDTDSKDSIQILLRQIPASMHGEGQIAVGYIIWSAAVILSRLICSYSYYFKSKRVLEIGAGTGLCGIVASACQAKVVITDYTEIILNNISQNIRLNTGNTLLNGRTGCLNQNDLSCEVSPYIKASPNRSLGLSF